jgi:hypothetical protein
MLPFLFQLSFHPLDIWSEVFNNYASADCVLFRTIVNDAQNQLLYYSARPECDTRKNPKQKGLKEHSVEISYCAKFRNCQNNTYNEDNKKGDCAGEIGWRNESFLPSKFNTQHPLKEEIMSFYQWKKKFGT